MKDEDIIDLYFSRNEQAIEETQIKYGKYLEKVAGNILCDRLDIEECVDDTYLKLWERIPPARPLIFKAFVGKITRELAFDRYRASVASKRGSGVIAEVLDELEECIPGNNSVEQTVLGNEMESIIKDFVNTLSKREAYIFTCRYFYAEGIPTIAEGCGISKHYVSVILGRVRKKLKIRLEKEGYYLS